MIATGDWVTDRTHGLQFKADEIKTTPPHTAEGIAKYLGSGLVKGIGPRFAGRIVEVFGEQTLDVIDQSPTFLTQVKGIGPKLIEKIRESWREQKTRSVDHGVPASLRHRHGPGRPHLQDLRRERHRDGEGQPLPPQYRHLGRRLRDGRRTGAEARASRATRRSARRRRCGTSCKRRPATATSASRRNCSANARRR